MDKFLKGHNGVVTRHESWCLSLGFLPYSRLVLKPARCSYHTACFRKRPFVPPRLI